MIIGLTGGIASGKSTVSKYLAEKGFKVYDADKIAKDISEKKLVQEEIIATFGDKILEENRNIDRKKLKEIVFEDKEKLKQLNAIIHPKVIDFYKKLKEKNTDEIIIFDVPLLFESGIEKFCDKILAVGSLSSIASRLFFSHLNFILLSLPPYINCILFRNSPSSKREL